MKMRVVDQFAGAGGLSLGFEMAGFETGYALEQDKWAAETFAANMPEVRLDVCDIRNIRDCEHPSAIAVPDSSFTAASGSVGGMVADGGGFLDYPDRMVPCG